MRKRKLPFSIKQAIVVTFSFILCFFSWRLAGALKDLDYFKIKHIVSAADNPIEFSHLKGYSIFNIDLKKESRYISELYPAYKKIKIIRIFPDRIFVDFTKRKPIACVKLYRYFYVDDDLLLFNAPASLEDADLPVILGLETKIFGVKPGYECNIGELTLAVNIIKELKANKALKDYKIKIIDALTPSNASFFIANGLEVKISYDNLKNKINILGSLLAQEDNGLNNIKYIDLRFKEPAIKLKEGNAK